MCSVDLFLVLVVELSELVLTAVRVFNELVLAQVLAVKILVSDVGFFFLDESVKVILVVLHFLSF